MRLSPSRMSTSSGMASICPPGDVLVIANDLCGQADSSFAAANTWLKSVREHYSGIIYFPGNHDWPIVEQPRKYRSVAPLLLDAILVNETTQVGGLRLHAMPWDFDDRDCPESLIPADLDILVTHESPLGILDWSVRASDDRLGNRKLRQRVEEVAPQLQLFGHCHMAYGAGVHRATTFVNLSTCGDPKKYYRRSHAATIVDIDRHSLTVAQ